MSTDAPLALLERLVLALEKALERLSPPAVVSPGLPNGMATVPALVEQMARIADALAPTPPEVVGTPYVAQRLGCTTVWVAELARQGTLPPAVVVRGTGHGKPWKFDREKVDRWLASR